LKKKLVNQHQYNIFINCFSLLKKGS